MKQIPYNTDKEGCASCIKAGYYKMGRANFIGHTNDGLKATCVIETMDKRLTQLLESGIEITDTCMLDTYNQQVQDNVSCTIRTNINTANHHFIMEKESIIFDDYNQRIPQDQDCIGTITTNIGNSAPRNGYKIIEPKVEQIVNIVDDRKNFSNPQNGRVYSTNGLCPTILTMQGGNKEPKIVSYTRSREDGSIQNRHLNDVANTIHDSTGQGGNTDSYVSEPSFRIRKLTERECFRLMGLADTDISKIQASGVSRSQQYKMAGNSIVVDVLFHIFRKLYIEPQCEHQQLTLF